MVLVGHDAIESRFVGHGVLLVVLVIEMVGFFRIEIGIGKVEAAGVVPADVLFVQMGVRLL